MLILDSLNDPRLPDLIRQGKVGVLPTDTIYGLAALAENPEAALRIKTLKGSSQNSGTIVAASAAQLVRLGLDPVIVQSVARFWPGPLSIELPIDANLRHLYHSGAHRAFRVVADDALRELLERTGPLLTSSANLTDQPPANDLKEAIAYFGENADYYVDGGDLSGRPPSTIARYADGTLQIVRQGASVVR